MWADLATERQHQLTTARANETSGLTNGRAEKWAQEVAFSLFHALSRRQLTFPNRQNQNYAILTLNMIK